MVMKTLFRCDFWSFIVRSITASRDMIYGLTPYFAFGPALRLSLGCMASTSMDR